MIAQEFIICGIVEGASGQYHVIGRCGDAPIRVNDTFDAVIRYKPLRYPDELGQQPIREWEEPASLRVVCIHAYERSLSLLGQGMTGSLVLEGQGLDHVVPGWVIGHRDELASGSS